MNAAPVRLADEQAALPGLVAGVTAAALVVLAVAVAFAATVLVAAGRLLGHPVRGRDAVRLSVRRLPALLVVLGCWVLFGLGVHSSMRVFEGLPLPVVLLTGALVAWIALPYLLLQVPAVMLLGLGPFAALRRVRIWLKGRAWRGRGVLTGLLVLTIGIDLAAERWVTGPLEETVGLGVGTLTEWFPMVLIAPIWAAVLAAMFPDRPTRGHRPRRSRRRRRPRTMGRCALAAVAYQW